MEQARISRRETLALGAVAAATTLDVAMAAEKPNMKRTPVNQDVIIVGGSFAGLSAAIHLARARRNVVVIDAGLPRNRFAKASHAFLGQDGVPPREIVEIARKQLLAYPTVSILGAEALSADAVRGKFEVKTNTGQQLYAPRLIIATGMKDELPPIKGLADRWGATALHCPYCHGYEVADRQLGVLGSSEMSIHQAALVADWGPVTLFTQNNIELNADQLALLSKRGVKVERSPIVELLGAAPELEAIRTQDGRVLPLGALFLAPRTRFVSDLTTKLGCGIEDGPTGPYLKVDERKQTTVPGVFAAGDVAAPFPNATFASAAGVVAGVSSHQSLIFS